MEGKCKEMGEVVHYRRGKERKWRRAADAKVGELPPRSKRALARSIFATRRLMSRLATFSAARRSTALSCLAAHFGSSCNYDYQHHILPNQLISGNPVLIHSFPANISESKKLVGTLSQLMSNSPGSNAPVPRPPAPLMSMDWLENQLGSMEVSAAASAEEEAREGSRVAAEGWGSAEVEGSCREATYWSRVNLQRRGRRNRSVSEGRSGSERVVQRTHRRVAA